MTDDTHREPARATGRRLAVAFSVVVAVIAVAIAAWPRPGRPSPTVRWTMVDVTADGMQGDAHLLEIGRHRVLIDVGPAEGAAQRLVPLLRAREIERLDHVFVSHAHRDHYGGLRPLIEAGIEIETVHFQLPDDAACASEVPWGCDADEIDDFAHRFAARLTRLVDGGLDALVAPSPSGP